MWFLGVVKLNGLVIPLLLTKMLNQKTNMSRTTGRNPHLRRALGLRKASLRNSPSLVLFREELEDGSLRSQMPQIRAQRQVLSWKCPLWDVRILLRKRERKNERKIVTYQKCDIFPKP